MTLRTAVEFTSHASMTECRKEIDACRDLRRDLELLRAKAKVIGEQHPGLNLRFFDNALIDLASDLEGPIRERERRFEDEGMAA